MNRGHREQTGYFRELVKYADETLTVKEIWEKAGKPCSLSNAYYVVRKNDLAHRKDTNKKRPFKYLEQIKCFQTHNLTIREIMGLLGLSTHNDYYCIHQTLIKNNLPFKYSDDKRKDRGSKYDFKLLALDTASMSIKEIAASLGITKTWEKSKLYTALRNLGLSYRKEK